jgi:ADP-ribosylglycohydrolase
LLGGAVGDALGAPVEFMNLARIRQQFGDQGIGDFVPAYGRRGAITDDTQMTLFTAEGLLRAEVRGAMRGLTSHVDVTGHAYLRWLETQGERSPIEIGRDGWLWGIEGLHDRRAPGDTCIRALLSKRAIGDAARNDSKGCGGVMRMAPVGLIAWHHRGMGDIGQRCFDLAVQLAGLTHGHLSGQWPAGVLAVLVMRALDRVPLPEALREAKGILKTKPDHEETLEAIEEAEILAAAGEPAGPSTVATLGRGWVAEEALAIGLYCAMVADNFEDGIRLAVNHSGDSDSTGSIAGNLLGARLGSAAIPARWLEPLELRDEIGIIAQDLHDFPNWNIGEYVTDGENERVWARYPGN